MPINLENRMVRMKGSLAEDKMILKNARIEEGFSQLTKMRIEFLSDDLDIDLQDIIGTGITIEVDQEEQETQFFHGMCISVEYIGLHQGMSHFVAEARPWLWFMTRTTDNRIYQQKTSVDIIKDLFGEYGFSDYEVKTTETYKEREYCVQYRETDFDFISRLMEEEGVYYFFKYELGKNILVLADSISAHSPVPNHAEIDFKFKEAEYRRKEDHIFDWSDETRVTTGKVTLEDYDFENPKKDLKAVSTIEKGNHSHKAYEFYRYPGHARTEGTGDTRARIRMEAEAVRHVTSRGVGNVREMRVGQTFKMKEHPKVDETTDYLVTNAVHLVQIETDYEDEESTENPFSQGNSDEFGEKNKDTYRCDFKVIPSAEPYRAPLTTPWPEIPGLQTAVVTGPDNEEIYTDEYGRIKVQFHWDREGQLDENTTCWVRCVMPWTGKNWGMISIPRIGYEVVIQFEEGDPDRPICTGMLYDGDNKPPYELPANKTQTGVVTRSSKDGSTSTFNELIFEDKKDAEFVRLQSEKDYKETIKNNAEITIGLEKKDSGDLTQTIHRNKTETLNTGDHTFTVKDGNQTIFVKKDHKEDIEGKCDQTITGNTTQTIKQGNLTRKVDMGNEKVTIGQGNYTLKTSLGKISEEAMQKIELKVGSNSITIDQTGITIKGLIVKIQGEATLEAKAPMTTVKGDGMLILQGALVKIN